MQGVTRRGHKIDNSLLSCPSGLYLYREMSQDGSGKTELGMLSRKEGAGQGFSMEKPRTRFAEGDTRVGRTCLPYHEGTSMPAILKRLPFAKAYSK